MNVDIDTLTSEDVSLKNEMHPIFKELGAGFEALISVYEKFEKPLTKIIDSLKDYARETAANQQDSPFFALANKYQALIDGQKQLIHDITDDIVLVMQQIVQKSILLNESIKDLNSCAKDARKLKNKIAKLEEGIELLHVKGKPEKITKKESEKDAKEAEYDLAKDKLKDSKARFDKIFTDFNEERNALLKKALTDIGAMEKTYAGVINDLIAEAESTAAAL